MPDTISIAGGTITWLMEDSIEQGAGLSLAEMTVNPGQVSELHRHANCTEVIHLLEGETRQRVGDHWQTMQAGDVCLIPVGTIHQTQNLGPDTARMIIAYSEGQRDYETVCE